jgi:UDP-glucose 4-epimerase
MAVLVTGGAGFIGSNLVDRLIEKGEEVHIFDNLSTGTRANVNSKAQFKIVDIAKGLPTHIKFDTIYHLAAKARIQPSFKDPVSSHNSNVTGTIHILELARRHDAKVVFAGSSSVYHSPYANPYTLTKHVGEQYCMLYSKAFGLKTAIARFFNVYGKRHLREGDYATVIGIFEQQKINNEFLTVTGSGEKRRDFTHVNDIVNGLIAIAEKNTDWNPINGAIFDFGRGKNHSINEIAAMFKPVGIQHIAERPGEADSTLADFSYSKGRLGWEPKHNVEDYIKEFIDFRDNAI